MDMRALRQWLTPFASLALMGGAAAQPPCAEPTWLPGDGIPGSNGTIQATMVWDRDGSGPEPARLVIGGQYSVIGSTTTSGIAAVDLTSGQWTNLAGGVKHVTGVQEIRCLATLDNGDLVVGGTFDSAGGVPANNVARWDGSSWAPLAEGCPSYINDLASLPNGDLMAATSFAPGSELARWNGLQWAGIDNGPNGTVEDLAVLPGGDLIASGWFETAGGVYAPHIARRDGSEWHALGTGVPYGFVNPIRNLTVLANADLIAVGHFQTAGGIMVNGVARWNGSEWSALGGGITQGFSAESTLELPGGDLLVGGFFNSMGGVLTPGIARWNGSVWSALGDGLGSGSDSAARTITLLPDGDIIAAGDFQNSGNLPLLRIARYDESGGTGWAPIATGFDSGVFALLTLPDDRVVVGGGFTRAGPIVAYRIASTDGAAWNTVGSGMNATVRALALHPSGDIVAGGDFTVAGGVPANRVARWNGSGWSPLGGGVNDNLVLAVACRPSGDIIVGGGFQQVAGQPIKYIARWDGTIWSSMGTTIDDWVDALHTLPNGDVVAGGQFLSGRISRWNGLQWFPFALGVGVPYEDVLAIARMPNGDVIAGGNFAKAGSLTVNGIARWDGAKWNSLGLGVGPFPNVQALAVLPNGNLLAAGQFQEAGGVPASGIARWDGTTWSGIDGGGIGTGYAIAPLSAGEFAVGGPFSKAGDQTSFYFAHFGCPPCVADCTGEGTLTVDDFICFQTAFLMNKSSADCDNSASLDIDDFICFQTLFAIGC